MADFHETARHIVKEMAQIRQGEKKTIEISGFLLCQGVVHFIEDVVAEDGTQIDLKQFDFDWDNDEAQRKTNVFLPLTISRMLSEQVESL